MYFPGDASPTGKHAGPYDPTSSLRRRLLIILCIIGLILLVAWPFMEPYMLEMETVTLTSDDLPASIGELRIVYVTDIHKGGLYTHGRLRDLISRINACHADLVLLGGDYASDSSSAIAFFESMPLINARYGVYAVVGNHDRTMPESNLLTLGLAMESAGVKPLVNQVARVRIGASDIYLAGIDDVVCGHPNLAGVASQVRNEDYVIFLCHNPKIIPDALLAKDMNGRINWYDLGLFGHTHGGQVFFWEDIVEKDGVPDMYTRGWVKQSRIDMLISQGVGTTGLPIRLLCRPQFHLITIKSGK